jgi:hypothetical protein
LLDEKVAQRVERLFGEPEKAIDAVGGQNYRTESSIDGVERFFEDPG